MSPAPAAPEAGFKRALGAVDAAVVVAGSILGVGIFVNPANVARIVGDPSLSVLAWIAGGVVALLGALVYAELGARLPLVGGQYRYLATAIHPAVGFLYGVALLFIINGGAVAAVAIVLAGHVDAHFVHLGPLGVRLLAAAVIATLTAINTVGVAAGKWTNNLLMAFKLLGIVALVALAAWKRPAAASALGIPPLDGRAPSLLLAAMVPVMFAYGGWQNCGAIAGEVRDPARNLARANLLGVAVVVAAYVGLNVVYLRVLPASAVASSTGVAADVARALVGPIGGRLVAGLIVVSCLGWLSVIVLTGPRLYYAMAQDGLFFRPAAALHPRFRTPVFSLWLQAAVSIALVAANTYDQLLSYVVFADWLFFALAAVGLFILRSRSRRRPSARPATR